ncbi:MAG: hypothetical protein IT427_11970 [Pirellulales bacterium]|nr:hypothetical protein [Pirellulales bacterium]
MPMTPPTETLLGRSTAPLGLRIRGTDRDGQVVWLNSLKVTIGSGSSSTLRLRAPGVAPVHCMILRGREQTIARCWSPDTRCNGRAFKDARLSTGDRLGIGPLELEVVAHSEGGTRNSEAANESGRNSGRPIDRSAPLSESAADATMQDPQIVKALNNIRRLGVRLRASRRQSRRRIEKLTEELRAARLRAGDLESQIAAHRKQSAANESHQFQWEQQRQAIDAERKQWLQTQSHIEQLLADLERRSEAATVVASVQATPSVPTEAARDIEREIADLRNQLETERNEWEAQRAVWEEKLVKREASLQEESSQLQQLQTNIQGERSALEAQVASLDEGKKQLESRGNDITQSQETLDEQRRVLRAEVEKLDRERSQFATECETFGKDRVEFEQSRQELIGSMEKLKARQSELDAKSQVLEDQRREIDAERDEIHQIAEQRQKIAEELQALNAGKEELERQQQELAETQRDIALAREELLQSKQAWEAEVVHHESPTGQPRQIVLPSHFAPDAQTEHSEATASADERVPVEPDEEQDGAAAPNSPGSEPTSTNPIPENSDEVFSRLRALDLLKSDEVTRTQETPAVEAAGESKTIEDSAENLPNPRRASNSAVEASESEDEDSIESYMARLLQRVGKGVAGNPPLTTTAAQGAKPKAAAMAALASEASTEPAALTDSPMRTLSELEPRSAAPEKSRDLAAMREIANFTARTAIAKHVWRTRIAMLLKRFAMGIVALVCGLILIVLAPSASSHYFLYGLTAITAAILWFLPSLYRAKKCEHQAKSAQQEAMDNYEKSPITANPPEPR